MIIKRPSFFFNYSDCCSGAPQASPQPCASDVVSDAYYNMSDVSEANVLGVVPGTNVQRLIKPPVVDGARKAGILMFNPASGKSVFSSAPELLLPRLNPPVEGAVPEFNGSFPFLMVAGPGNGQWQFLAAPTEGQYILQSHNGGFVLVDAGQIPGLNEIADDATYAAKALLLGITVDGDGNATARKLNVIHRRVVVGDIDGDGVAGYKPLGTTEELFHGTARFDTLRVKTQVNVNDAGEPIPGGLDTIVTTGGGAILDAKRVVYSPSAMKYFYAPAVTIQSAIVSTNTGLVTVPSSYGLIPSGHGQVSSAVHNYPKVRIDFKAGLSIPLANNTQVFGIFRDGSLVQEFDNDNLLSVGFSFIDTVTLGAHTYDVRWKRTSGTDQGAMRNSNFLVHSLPE